MIAGHKSQWAPMSRSRIACGYVTSGRTGGDLKAEPEDFEVEEIPAYEPNGEGEHLFLWVEKRDVSADALQARLSAKLHCDRSAIGTAGLKDRRAVTRQWVSVPASCEPRLLDLNSDDVRVLKSARHRNKLRTGHLRGNRFRIRLRGVAPHSMPTAHSIAAALRERGVPNLYGDQRFGLDESTLDLGLGLLRGSRRVAQIPPSKRRFLFRLALSAVQSALFNDVLAHRLNDGLLHRALLGDVMQVVASGGLFVSTDPSVDQPRLDGRDITPTGPMFGPEMKLPMAVVADRESAVLEMWELPRSAFEQFRNLTPGTRRALLVFPDDLNVMGSNGDLILSFGLPSGAYATSVVREFQKPSTTANAPVDVPD
jgi:tRNA pseudouridine13 synthase